MILKEDQIYKETIVGSKRLSNYLLVVILLIGGFGFLLTGLSSFIQFNLLPFLDIEELLFIPQGIIMVFYGVAALTTSFYIILTIVWDVGGGYNEFNKVEGLVRIVRNGFPGKTQKIFLVYPFSNLKSIKLFIKDGLNPKRVIFLCTKDQKEIPISGVQEPLSLNEIEKQAFEFATFLNIKLEGL